MAIFNSYVKLPEGIDHPITGHSLYPEPHCTQLCTGLSPVAVDIEAGCPPPRDPHALFDRQNALGGNLRIKDESLAMQQETFDWRYLPYIYIHIYICIYI